MTDLTVLKAAETALTNIADMYDAFLMGRERPRGAVLNDARKGIVALRDLITRMEAKPDNSIEARIAWSEEHSHTPAMRNPGMDVEPTPRVGISAKLRLPQQASDASDGELE